MASGQNRVVFIGIDQAITGLMLRFMNEGILPNISRLVDRGTMTRALSCPPCDTPTNWASLATGATTGVHGCTSFYPHEPGEPFEEGLHFRSRSMLSRFCQAEYIWDVADASGLRSFVINYPSGWPGTMKHGVMSSFTWTLPECPKRVLERAKTRKCKPSSRPSVSLVALPDSDVPPSILERSSKRPVLKANLGHKRSSPFVAGYITGHESYDTLFYLDGDRAVGVPAGEWSGFLSTTVMNDGKETKTLFKVRLQHVDEKEPAAAIDHSPVYAVDAWVNPPSEAEPLIRHALGDDVSYASDVEYMIDGEIEDFLEEARTECNGIVKALAFMKQRIGWDLAMFHVHFLDSVNHYSLAYITEGSPLSKSDPDGVAKAWANVRTAYKLIDGMVGELLDSVIDERTVVILVADHGAIPAWKTVNLAPAFERAGLSRYTEKEGERVIDWSRTRAFPCYEPLYAWVNLKGRDPNGIVENTEYETVRDDIIALLESLEDPETGKKIVRVAFKKEDAAFLGQSGRRVGDVVYFLNPPYQVFDGDTGQLDATSMPARSWNLPLVKDSEVCFGAHAYYLPTATMGECGVPVPLIVAGPGIKQGAKLDQPVHVIDVAPTIARILGIRPPRHAQGRVLHQLFDDS